MAISIPCPQSIQDCVCTDDPVSNYSSEDPDQPVFFGHFDNPPTTGTYFAPGCFALCESTVSQEAADECARDQAIACSTTNIPTFDNPVPRPNALRFVTTSLDALCADAAMSQALIVEGGTLPYEFSLVSGSLPTGLVLDTDGTISGTPTVGGTFTFVARVRDSSDPQQVDNQLLSLTIIEITSPSALPDAMKDSPYSTTLEVEDATFPISWSITGGALPTGLSMPASGVISGTPTVAGGNNFTATVTDANSIACSKDFTLEVESVVGLSAYWAFETLSGGNLLLDSTTNAINLDTAFEGGTIVPGKITNCYQKIGQTVAENFDNPAVLNDITNGVTMAGWFRPVDFDISASIAEILFLEWGGDSLILYADSGFYKLDMQVGIDFIDVSVATADDNLWHFYRAWYDPSDGKIRLQIDNGAIATSTFAISVPPPFAANNVKLGPNIVSVPGNTRQWDETGIWMRVLSAGEGSDLWNGGAGITFGNPLMPP